MAVPIAAGILAGAGLYYISRLAPRIAARAAAAERARTQQHLSTFLRGRTELLPYHLYEHPFRKAMSEKEAMLLLGFSEAATGALAPRPSQEDVKKRYREMMKEFHSDIAGSALIATKINEARDVLSR